MTPDQALAKAIEICGGARAVADHLKIERQAVYKWHWCPAARAIPLEIATAGKITRYQLRPDLYPAEQSAKPPKRKRK